MHHPARESSPGEDSTDSRQAEVIVFASDRCAHHAANQPFEYMLKIFHQRGMWTRFPHQILLGGVAVVVVVVDYIYVIIGPLDHGALLLCLSVCFSASRSLSPICASTPTLLLLKWLLSALNTVEKPLVSMIT